MAAFLARALAAHRAGEVWVPGQEHWRQTGSGQVPGEAPVLDFLPCRWPSRSLEYVGISAIGFD
jgi:hypothetical protein